MRPRLRHEAFKTQPCVDLTRKGPRVCTYGTRCNYVHIGEPVRRAGSELSKREALTGAKGYIDDDYFSQVKKDFPDFEYPFGVYV